MSERGRALCLAGFVVAMFATFPHPVAGRVLDLGWLLAWIAPGLLILGIDGRAPAAAARVGWLAGLAAHGLVLHWIFVVTVIYGQAPAAIGVVAPLLLAGYMATFTAAFAAAWAAVRRRGIGGPFTAAFLWTASDHARSFVLTGFPWATLGYGQHENPALLGLVQWTGVYGLSFVSVLGAAAWTEWVLARRGGREPGRAPVVALAGVAVLAAIGALAPDPSPSADAPTVRVAALQGNIGQGEKWSRAWADRTLDRYDALARRAADGGARIVVWPETAAPGALGIDPSMRDRVERLARETGTIQVVGSVGVERDFDSDDVRYFDSAFVLSPAGEIIYRYDKSHLVPFGEFVPFRDLLGRFFGAVARGIAAADVTAGEGPRALTMAIPIEGNAGEAPALDGAELGVGAGAGILLGENAGAAPALDGAESDESSAGEGPALGLPDSAGPTVGAAPAFSFIRAGVPICYELLFPNLVRRFVKDGGQVLFAITNDAWYGDTGAPHQFLAITALRSAETGAWTVRAANTGVTSVIDGRGRVREQIEIFEQGLVLADVPLLPAAGEPNSRPTFYVRHGDVFAVACWVVAAIQLGRARYAGRERPVKSGEMES